MLPQCDPTSAFIREAESMLPNIHQVKSVGDLLVQRLTEPMSLLLANNDCG